MYSCNGNKASELAAMLAELIEVHGNCRLMVGPKEYPEDCQGMYCRTDNETYYRADTFVMH